MSDQVISNTQAPHTYPPRPHTSGQRPAESCTCHSSSSSNAQTESPSAHQSASCSTGEPVSSVDDSNSNRATTSQKLECTARRNETSSTDTTSASPARTGIPGEITSPPTSSGQKLPDDKISSGQGLKGKSKV
ncbi:hypothetical protein GYMLUDRAFT_253615 [Collybiopsis luxurians FD-317 M1]|uniref:Uncharacterized protein n=1 Tax=Collybiopsis luxurians FD-317 M1 TaxID=944289 RepID=A0A0D0AI05_9AGAR|nr:hypothetical protein GYMLUDRAFT_253615 [Collybiopsis luxurians FD-317 M1]